MTNETEYFTEFEESYYKENITETEKKKMQYTNQHRITKVLNKSLVKSNSLQPKFSSKLFEYDILRKLIKLFQLKNFSKVSYVFGGYKEVHNLGLKYHNVNLIEHEPIACDLCINNRYNKPLKKTSSASKLDSTSRYSSMVTSKSRKNSLGSAEKFVIGQKINKCKIQELIDQTGTTYYLCYFIEFKVANSKLAILNQPENGSPTLSILNNNSILLLNFNSISKQIHSQSFAVKDWLDSTDEFPIFEIVEIENISNILTKKLKNIVTIDYITTIPGVKTPQTKSVILDFKKDTDSKDFISSIKKKIAV